MTHDDQSTPDEEIDPSTHQPLHDVTSDDDEVEVATAHRADSLGGNVQASSTHQDPEWNGVAGGER